MIGPKDLLIGCGMLLHQLILPLCCTCSRDTHDHNAWIERRARKQRLRERPNCPPPRKKDLSRTSLSSSQKPPPPLLHLPPEIRLIIYEYAVGGNRFELTHRPKHIVLEKRLYSEAVNVRGGVKGVQKIDWKRPYNHLSLALTSRQVYHEVISLLYSCNTFVAKDPYVVVNFTMYSLQPQRLPAIRDLELTWTVRDSLYNPVFSSEPYDSDAWLDCWTVVATRLRLASLKLRLIVSLSIYRPRDDLKDADGWIQPLLIVENIRKLELVWTCRWETHYTAPEQVTMLKQLERRVVTELKEKGNRVISHIEGDGKL